MPIDAVNDCKLGYFTDWIWVIVGNLDYEIHANCCVGATLHNNICHNNILMYNHYNVVFPDDNIVKYIMKCLLLITDPDASLSYSFGNVEQ